MSEQPLVSINIPKRFTDSRNRLWGAGIVEVPPSVAQRLIASGRARAVSGAAVAGVAEAMTTTPAPAVVKKKSGYVKKADREAADALQQVEQLEEFPDGPGEAIDDLSQEE